MIVRSIRRNSLFALVTLSMAVIVLSCQSGEDSEDRFDRGAMLEHYADQLIIPAYTDLQNDVADLQSKAEAFTGTPTVAALEALQQSWTTTYTSFQYANAYNFGPAAAEGTAKSLLEEIATFPVSPAKIDGAVSSGVYNLNDFNRDARGFLAIEYLIFSLDGDQQGIVDAFASETRKEYLTGLAANIKTRVDAVLTSWTTGYRNEFVSRDGTDAGSGTSLLYNEFVKSYESIKNFKVALPLGLRPGQTTTEPERVEAYYSGKSVEMIKAHYDGIEDIWYGRTRAGSDGVGFREYLEAVEGGNALIASTEAQLAVIRAKLQEVSDTPRLSEQLVTDPSAFDALHTELQNHIRYFKSDMSSLLGIAITYSSGDGD